MILFAWVAPRWRPAPAIASVHSWATRWAPDSGQRSLVDTLRGRVYLRLMDIDLDPLGGGLRTIAPLAFEAPWPTGREAVPTVFLRERALRGLDSAALHGLALRVVRTTRLILGSRSISWKELQIDCDWSAGTRDAYFSLLRSTAGLLDSGRTVSSTLRLHQVRDRETMGVPPVKRVLLMLYNMGPTSASAEDTAMLDLSSTSPWLATLKTYPTRLDLALPVWTWWVHLRDTTVVGLVQGRLPDPTRENALEPLGSGRFRVRRSTWMAGTFFREGDVIKVESASPEALHALVNLVVPHLKPDPGRDVSFFSLDALPSPRFPPTLLVSLARALRAARPPR